MVEGEDHAAVSLLVVRPKLERTAVRLDGLVEPTSVGQQPAEVGVGMRIRGLECNRTLEARERIVTLTLLIEDDAKAVEGVDVRGIEREHGTVARGRFAELMQPLQGVAEVVL